MMIYTQTFRDAEAAPLINLHSIQGLGGPSFSGRRPYCETDLSFINFVSLDGARAGWRPVILFTEFPVC